MVTKKATGRRFLPLVAKKRRVELDLAVIHVRRSIRTTE